LTRFVHKAWLAASAVAGLAGCVWYPEFGLPPLDPPASQRAPSGPYSFYGYGTYDPGPGYYDPGHGYYAYRYDPLYGYYAPRYSYYYAPGTVVRYPGLGLYPYPRGPYCVDANRDGRCDTRRHDRDGDNDGRPGRDGDGRGHDGRGPGLGPNPIERLRDIDRRVPAGAVQNPANTSRPPPNLSQARPVVVTPPPPSPRAEPARPNAAAGTRVGRDVDATPKTTPRAPRVNDTPTTPIR
jgi:hypothetical protein